LISIFSGNRFFILVTHRYLFLVFHWQFSCTQSGIGALTLIQDSLLTHDFFSNRSVGTTTLLGW